VDAKLGSLCLRDVLCRSHSRSTSPCRTLIQWSYDSSRTAFSGDAATSSSRVVLSCPACPIHLRMSPHTKPLFTGKAHRYRVRVCLLLCLFLYALAFLYKILCLRVVFLSYIGVAPPTDIKRNLVRTIALNFDHMGGLGDCSCVATVWHCQRPSYSPHSPTTTAHIIRSWHLVRPVAYRYRHGSCSAYCACFCFPVPTYHWLCRGGAAAAGAVVQSPGYCSCDWCYACTTSESMYPWDQHVDQQVHC
jgi:hypothetical protein